MTERRIEHIYNCSENVFWEEVFLDPEYNRTLYVDQFHFESWELISEEVVGDELHRTVRAVPQVPDLPGPLKKLARDGVGYTEKGILNRSQRKYRLTVTPQSMASKLEIHGELSTEPLGEHQCRRVYVGTVVAKVFGVGGMIEQRILDDISRSYNKAAAFTNAWLADKAKDD